MNAIVHGLIEAVAKKDQNLGTILREIIKELEQTSELTIDAGESLKAIDQTEAAAERKVLILDDKNVIRLGPEAAASGDFHIAIPVVDNPPPVNPSVTKDGLLYINKTTNELCYTVNKNRYKLVGAAF